jgi:hypothetical protein
MKTFFTVCAFSIASLSIFVLILAYGFQTQSLVDVFGGTFDNFESGYELFLTFVVPLILVLGFSIVVFSIFRVFD